MFTKHSKIFILMLLKIIPKTILYHSFISLIVFLLQKQYILKKKKSKRKTKIPTFPEVTIKTLMYILPTFLLWRHVPLYNFFFYKMWSYCTCFNYCFKNTLTNTLPFCPFLWHRNTPLCKRITFYLIVPLLQPTSPVKSSAVGILTAITILSFVIGQWMG